MKSKRIPFSEPVPAGSIRAKQARDLRNLVTDFSRLNPQALTRSNNEETDHAAPYPANFTKGLKHNKNGLLAYPQDYWNFVEAINSDDSNLFDRHVETAATRAFDYVYVIDHHGANADEGAVEEGGSESDDYSPFICTFSKDGDKFVFPEWRAWESPRSGHVFELQGPDAGAVGMAPAPRVGSAELAFEMAEVYGVALLRDVPFTTIQKGGGRKISGGNAVWSAERVVKSLNKMAFLHHEEAGEKKFTKNRRHARLLGAAHDGPHCHKLTPQTVFRGSTPGAFNGPYISQFMLMGSGSLAGNITDNAGFDLSDGYIAYGNQVIDQRVIVHKEHLDYMTDWNSWLDVQNGANFKGADQYESKRRFITTPRDLATYVHFDALYQAYLNACLILLSRGMPQSRGFPEPSASGLRDAFATFGGPHILSLVTEVATRCLKAVRRQKFNYHRRCRPEAIGGRFTLVDLHNIDEVDRGGEVLANRAKDGLQNAFPAFEETLGLIGHGMKKAIKSHNADQNSVSRRIDCGDENTDFPLNDSLLLPMAFPEGSPMHPAYGAGHATVAGGCITMLKAFFDMFEEGDSFKERALFNEGEPNGFVPSADGLSLKNIAALEKPLTIQGELDKLAANISIGRNMAGVHFYSDYYDSLRMGERIAVGILLEQAPTYGDAIESTFTSFDGDHINISGAAYSCPSLSVIGSCGGRVSPEDWWLRHVPGQEFSEDL